MGLLSHDGGRTFEIIKAAIEEAGYGVHWREVTAAEAWVPQQRERVFITCFRKDLNPDAMPYLLPSLTNFTVDEILEDFEEHQISKIERPVNFSAPYVIDRKIDSDRKKIQRLGGYSKQAQGARVYSVHGRGVTLCSQGGGGGALTGLYDVGVGKVRKLTKLEAQRMAGFPDDFIADEKEVQAQRQFGNSVCPPAVDSVLVCIIGVLQRAQFRPICEEPSQPAAEVVHDADGRSALGLSAEDLLVQEQDGRLHIGLGVPTLGEDGIGLDLGLSGADLPNACRDDDFSAFDFDDGLGFGNGGTSGEQRPDDLLRADEKNVSLKGGPSEFTHR